MWGANESWLLPHMEPPHELLSANLLRNIQSHRMFNDTPVGAYIGGHALFVDHLKFDPCTEPSLLTNPATLDSDFSLMTMKIWPVRKLADSHSLHIENVAENCSLYRTRWVQSKVSAGHPRRIVVLSGDRVLDVLELVNDARVFSYGRRTYLLNTPHLFVVTAAAGQRDRGLISNAKWRSLLLNISALSVPDEVKKNQKNWTPLQLNEPRNSSRLLLYCTFCPPLIFSCNVESGECETYAEEKDNAACNAVAGVSIHGGSPLIQVEHILLGVVHHFYPSPGNMHALRHYTQRFVKVEATPPHKLLAFSPPFRFPAYFGNANDEIQFCPGLTLAPGGEKLVLTYGQGDAAALSVRVDVSKVLESLQQR